MDTVSAMCSTCGPIEVPVRDVVIWMSVRTARCAQEFRCPGRCQEVLSRPISQEASGQLQHWGAALRTWSPASVNVRTGEPARNPDHAYIDIIQI